MVQKENRGKDRETTRRKVECGGRERKKKLRNSYKIKDIEKTVER